MPGHLLDEQIDLWIQSCRPRLEDLGKEGMYGMSQNRFGPGPHGTVGYSCHQGSLHGSALGDQESFVVFGGQVIDGYARTPQRLLLDRVPHECVSRGSFLILFRDPSF